jgi:FkbM family methyltransferase
MLNLLSLDPKYIAYTLDLRRYLLKFLFASRPFPIQFGQAKFMIQPRSSDLFTIYEIFRDQGYYPKLSNISVDFKTVVDFGANIGVFSIWACQTFQPQTVVAVEMEANCYNRLVDNIALNSLDGSIHPFQAAIFAQSGAVGARKVPGSTFYALTPSKSGSRVRSLSFADFLETTQLDRIDLLKIDIEGAEKYLLTEENTPLFQRQVGYILLETHTLNDFRFEQAVAYLSGLGFRLALMRTPYALDRNYIIDAYNPG